MHRNVAAVKTDAATVTIVSIAALCRNETSSHWLHNTACIPDDGQGFSFAGPNQANIQECGNRSYDEGRFEAARILYLNVKNYGRCASAMLCSIPNCCLYSWV